MQREMEVQPECTKSRDFSAIAISDEDAMGQGLLNGGVSNGGLPFLSCPFLSFFPAAFSYEIAACWG